MSDALPGRVAQALQQDRGRQVQESAAATPATPATIVTVEMPARVQETLQSSIEASAGGRKDDRSGFEKFFGITLTDVTFALAGIITIWIGMRLLLQGADRQ